jgi:hypothetical protein
MPGRSNESVISPELWSSYKRINLQGGNLNKTGASHCGLSSRRQPGERIR